MKERYKLNGKEQRTLPRPQVEQLYSLFVHIIVLYASMFNPGWIIHPIKIRIEIILLKLGQDQR